jgi:hypothetical protein
MNETPNQPGVPSNNIDTTDIVVHKSGASSSYCSDYTQIPLEAMTALADRFALGAIKHGRGNWRGGLPDKDYVRERLNHIIRHAMTLQAKLEGLLPWDEDDDAGALIWGGCFAVCAQNLHRPEDAPAFESAKGVATKAKA